MKLKLKNFQATKSGTIEFNPGITLITGQTNNGKTSIFRALLCLLLNPAKAVGYINNENIEEDPNREMVITLLDENLPVIEYHRTQQKAWYIIDGKRYSKLGRSTLFDIYPPIGKFFVYDAQDPRKVLNFQTEKNLAFPFDKSETEMFKLFEKIFSISDVRQILDTMKKEESEAIFKLTQTQSEKEKLESEILLTRVCLDKIEKSGLKSLYLDFKTISSLLQKHYQILMKAAQYTPYIKLLQKLPNIKIDLDDSKILESLTRLEHKLKRCSTATNYIQKYSVLGFKLVDIDKNLEETISKQKTKIQQILSIESSIRNQKAEMEKQKVAMIKAQEELDNYRVCPLCGQELEVNHVGCELN